MEQPSCAHLIRCLNERRHLPMLLEGIKRQTVAPAEILVVDSGSTDGTVEIAQAAGARVLHIARSEFSFGRAINYGAASAEGEVLVIVSAHTYPLTEVWLERLLAPFEHPEVALVYGGQRGDRRTKFSEQQLFRQWFPDESHADQRHPFCNNANAAIRRQCWASLPYDEELPGLEDIDWARRALSRGYRLVYRHDATVAHVHEESYGTIYRRYEREAMALSLIAPAERLGLRDALGLMRRAMASDLREAARQRVLPSAWWSILCFRAAQYLGAHRGFRWRGTLTSELRARLYYPRGYAPQPAALKPAPAVEAQPMAAGVRSDAE